VPATTTQSDNHGKLMSGDPEKLAEGTLISHLLELRDRLIKALMGVGLVFLPCMMYANDISRTSRSRCRKGSQGREPHARRASCRPSRPRSNSRSSSRPHRHAVDPVPTLGVRRPGLYRNEKRFAVPLLVSAILLFYVGVLFAYFFVFPVILLLRRHDAQGRFDDDGHQQLSRFRAGHVFRLRAAFEVPVAVVLLVITGIVKLEKLRENRGYVLLGIFIFAAMLTPPDAVSPIHPRRTDVPSLRRRTSHGPHSPAH